MALGNESARGINDIFSPISVVTSVDEFSCLPKKKTYLKMMSHDFSTNRSPFQADTGQAPHK